MGRGRKGGITSSARKASHNSDKQVMPLMHKPPAASPCWLITPAQLKALQRMSNEQLAAVILFPAARPSTPLEQTPSSGHRAGSTPRVSLVSLQSSES